MELADVRAFAFTESRVEQAIKLVASGRAATKADGRRYWRDEGSPHGLMVMVGVRSATYYRLHKVAGRKIFTRIGDATAMRVSVARSRALKLAGGDATAAAAPIRVRTDGITVKQAWEAYIADTESGEFIAGRKRTAPSTIRSYKELFRPHLEKVYGPKSLHYLAKHVQDIHKSLRHKPATANRLLQVLRNLFTHAARTGNWSAPNPTIDPITGRIVKKYSVASRERWLTTVEAGRVMAFAATEPDPWHDFWPLLILTGVRASNLREMRWSELDLRADAVWGIPSSKNGEPLIIPLVKDAAAILRARLAGVPATKGKPDSPWVFPMQEDRTRCIVDIDHAWTRVKEESGIKDVRIHDLRRTAGSWATQAGAPLPAVGKMLGHKSHNATARYARADIASARGAAELVADRLREARTAK
jgi:integrase